LRPAAVTASFRGSDRLVWFEPHDTAPSAISREKNIKKGRRDWKIRLIEETNPEWLDLSVGAR
jgi:putative endonuclease